jgi:hypothetical protein
MVVLIAVNIERKINCVREKVHFVFLPAYFKRVTSKEPISCE